MIKRLLVFLFLTFILASCKAGNNVIVISTITPFSNALPAAGFTPSLTPTQTGTPTVSPDVIRYQCLQVLDSLPLNYSLEGVIVFNDAYNLYAFLSNEETNDIHFFPREDGDRLLEFDVSPDRKWIMYEHYSDATKEQRLVIAASAGEPIWSRVIDSYLWKWFDNERIVHLEDSGDGIHILQLLSPFTGEQQNLRADYPDSRLFSKDWFPSWRYTNGGLPIYDPTLTRALYPECDSQCQDRLIRGEPGWPIALWDAETNQVMTRIMTMDDYGETPIWTPDGKQFILSTNLDPSDPHSPVDEFFAVSRDGKIRQLTHFVNYFKEINIPDNYSLSPNGKMLAFWIVAKPSQYEDAQLTVLNVETGVSTNYCINGDDVDFPSDPIWSPDSTQLLVVSRKPGDTQLRSVVMVDIVKNYAAQIEKDIEPVGWMISP